MSQRLAGKVSIVTGGGFGFGEGTVSKFIAEGSKVVLVDVNAENTQRVAALHPEGTISLVNGDVSSASDWEKIVSVAVLSFGKIDIVVNNAGIINKATPSTELSEAEFDRLINVNTKSIYHSARATLPVLQKQGNGGAFVNISSISAHRPRGGLVWYTASKSAVSVATKGLAAELAPAGIRCNIICPVAGDTAMMPLVMGKPDTPENRRELLRGISLGRFATPEDIANAALFLASDEASLITGAELFVDGGRFLA